MSNRTISVFEHDRLFVGTGKRELSPSDLTSLQQFHSVKGSYYYSLIYEGVKFNSFVGVLQVGSLTIEILPKADRYTGKEEDVPIWQRRLIAMLRSVGVLPLQAPSSSSLQLKANSLLDLYFSLYIDEVNRLLHQGLVKQYKKIESNSLAVKGKLLIGKHIQKNFAHQERNYIAHTVYSTSNVLNGLLYEALKLLQQINTSPALQSSINNLLLNFPEQEPLKVTEQLFDRITFNRKTECYRPALTIAKLILLNYHPDVQQGRDHVLAILFDMNVLWERFVYHSLIRFKNDDVDIAAQNIKPFWQPSAGDETTIRPDIVISKKNSCAVLDTKWKNLKDANPSASDLRQLYVYHHYYQADKVALVYPGYFNKQDGFYFDDAGALSSRECAVLFLPPAEDIDQWQKDISDAIGRWLDPQTAGLAASKPAGTV